MDFQNSYVYNIETKKLKHWDPFTKNIDISQLKNYEIDNNHLFILGPEIDRKRFIWLFKFVNSAERLTLNSLKTGEDYSPILDLVIEENVGKINYVNSSDEYNGNKLMGWVLQIFKSLNLSSCILNDFAQKNCIGRNTYSYISLSLISKLKKNHQTYYEKYGFKPFRMENKKIVNNGRNKAINSIYEDLIKIRWKDFAGINNKHIIKFKNIYGNVYQNYPFLVFEEFTQENCKIFYDFLSVIMTNKNFPGNYELTTLQNFISKSIWEKKFPKNKN